MFNPLKRNQIAILITFSGSNSQWDMLAHTNKDLTTDNVHTIAEMQNSIIMLERKFFGCRLLYRCVCTFSHFNKWPTDLLCATKEDITQQRAKQTKPYHTRPNEQEKLLSKCVGGKTISWENNDVYFNKFTCTYLRWYWHWHWHTQRQRGIAISTAWATISKNHCNAQMIQCWECVPDAVHIVACFFW